MKKIIAIMLLLTILISSFSTISAAQLKTNLNIVQKESEQKLLEQGDSYYANKIVSVDSKKGIVDMEMTINNISAKEDAYKDTEIFIIVDENIADEANLSEYISHIETLATKIFDKNNNAKIGIIGMKGSIDSAIYDSEGNITNSGEDGGDILGTENDAEILADLTKNITDLTNSVQNMNNANNSYRSNLQAAIRLANNSYSNNVNKILISLFDGVPVIAIGEDAIGPSYGGWFSQYETIEESTIAHFDSIVSRTKSEILDLDNNNVNFILIRPADTSFNKKVYNSSTGEYILNFDGSNHVKELYGTLTSPTYGTMYSLNSENLEKVVTESIYADVVEKIGAVLTNTKVNIHFTDEILDNFDIIIDNNKVDKTKLEEDGYITWDVGDIETLKSATLTYSLKIKDMNNKDILDKVLNITKKVDLTYNDYLDANKTVSLNTHPSVKLIELKENVNNKPVKDETPATGTNLSIIYKLLDILF